MTLRQRTLWIVGGTLALMILILYFAARAVVVGGFSRVEKDLLSGFSTIETANTGQAVQQVRDALKLRIKNLEVKFADWAQWDDTYRYVSDRNRAYERSNLTPEALATLKVSLMLLLDEEGNRVFGTGFNLETNEATPVPESIEPFLAPGARLLNLPTPHSVVSGILSLPEGNLMVVALPVVKTDGTGPIRGTLVSGRFLDKAELDLLGDVTHLSFRMVDVDDPGMPDDFKSFKETLAHGTPILVKTQSEAIVSGYAACLDLYGAPALLLRVDLPRDVYRQGLATQRAIRERGRIVLLSLVASILVTGIALGAVIHFALESSVLSRLAALTRRAEEIGAGEDFSGRVESRGTDEIARLAGSVNRMLDALAASHGAMQSRNAEMGLLMDTVPTGLLSLDDELRVNPEYSRSAAEMLGGGDLRGRDYPEVLGLTGGRAAEAEELREFLGFVRDDHLPEESLAALNPFREIQLVNGAEHRLCLHYRAIHRGLGRPNHVLAVLEDVTEARRLAAQVAKSECENVQLKAMVEDPDLFREFLTETGQNLRDALSLAARLDDGGPSRPTTDRLFRLVHTVKGVAGSFGLGQISEAASGLEDRLESLREEEALSPEAVREVRTALDNLHEVYAGALEAANQILGDDVSAEGAVHLRVSSLDLKRFIEEVAGMEGNGSGERLKREVVGRLQAIRAVPAQKGLARALKTVPGLMGRLGKDVEFRFEGRDTPLDCDLAHELNTPLVHLLRNALDHGI
ncbi:MAG: HAMP domain-containing protein, partial [Deltaproteobacteria bacterium]|nr:HAMP domain-containing protein [Deltaproteobacteria bacterium]